MAVQKVFISILNFIYNRTSWMSRRTRTVLMYAFLSIIIVSTYFYQAKRFFLYDYPAMLNSLIGMCAFAGFLIVSVDRKIEPVKLRSWLLYVLMLCGLVIMISGLHHYIGYSYILMGFFMTFFMPACIITWCARKDFDTLFRCIAVIGVVCFIVYYVISIVTAPIGENLMDERYAGIAADPNGVAKTAVASCVCGIYLLTTISGRKKFWMIPVIAASIAMNLVTVSRANLTAMGIILICGIIMGVKYLYYHGDKARIKRSVLFAVILVILIPVFMSGLKLKDFYNQQFVQQSSEEVTASSAETAAGTTDPSSSEIKVNEVMDQRIHKGSDGENGIDLNTASSGRLAIWNYGLSKSSLLGNDVKNGAIFISTANRNYYHMHNTVLELLYRSGIFAGGLFLILELYCAWWILRNVFSKRVNRTWEIFAIMAITAFGIASLFDIVVLPFAKQTVAMFYLSLPCVMATNHEKEDNQNPDEHI